MCCLWLTKAVSAFPILPQHPFPLNEMKLFCLLPEIYNTYPQFRFAGACVNLFIWISFCGCLFPVSRTQSYFSTVFGQLCITNFLGSKWRAKCFPLRAFLGSAFQVLKINVTFGPLLSPFPFCSSHIFPGRAWMLPVHLAICMGNPFGGWENEMRSLFAVIVSASAQAHKKKTDIFHSGFFGDLLGAWYKGFIGFKKWRDWWKSEVKLRT